MKLARTAVKRRAQIITGPYSSSDKRKKSVGVYVFSCRKIYRDSLHMSFVSDESVAETWPTSIQPATRTHQLCHCRVDIVFCSTHGS